MAAPVRRHSSGPPVSDADWLAWLAAPDDADDPPHHEPHAFGLRPAPPRRTPPARLRTEFGPVATPPVRTRWTRIGWALRDVGLVIGVGLVVVGAWVVLVNLRGPEARVATDQLALLLDGTVAQSLRADRIAAFGTWIVNVTSMLVLGGVVFCSFVTTAESRTLDWSPRRTVRWAAVVGALASLATVPFRAAALTGTGRVAMTDPDTLHFVVTSRFGSAALLRVAGLLLATFAVPGPARPDGRDEATLVDHVLGGAGAVLVLGSYAWVGHPQATEAPGPLLVLGQSVHVLAVATWFGGVALLYLQIRAGRRAGAVRTSAEVVERFSTAAGVSVALVAASGVALARSQVASLDALTTTPYGRALAIKLVLVALVIAIGGYNKVFAVPRVVDRQGPVAWRTLHRTLLAEAALIAGGVLLATTAMTSGGI
jgi:putative copper export protein